MQLRQIDPPDPALFPGALKLRFYVKSARAVGRAMDPSGCGGAWRRGRGGAAPRFEGSIRNASGSWPTLFRADCTRRAAGWGHRVGGFDVPRSTPGESSGWSVARRSDGTGWREDCEDSARA